MYQIPALSACMFLFASFPLVLITELCFVIFYFLDAVHAAVINLELRINKNM